MFVFIMKTNGDISLCSSINNDENQACKLISVILLRFSSDNFNHDILYSFDKRSLPFFSSREIEKFYSTLHRTSYSPSCCGMRIFSLIFLTLGASVDVDESLGNTFSLVQSHPHLHFECGWNSQSHFPSFTCILF